jgi:hypothetical protein
VDLSRLTEEAASKGWSSSIGTIDVIRRQAGKLGWLEAPVRVGDPALTVLRPVEKSAAHSRSISAIHGLDEQPLHTDGAHVDRPPDLIVMACSQTSPTSTRLWRPGQPMKRGGRKMPNDDLEHGVFLVDTGGSAFFATARTGRRYRYDPGCMLPCDARARAAADYLAHGVEDATDFAWSEPGLVLVIDNRRVLHGRAAVCVDDETREIQRLAFHLKAVS